MEQEAAVPPPGRVPEPERQVEYTRADMARALEGAEFASLTSAVEGKLGKKLTTPDLATLLGLYDQVGLPADVIFLLVGFCAERTIQRMAPDGGLPSARLSGRAMPGPGLGLMTQESAAAYIKDYQQRRKGPAGAHEAPSAGGPAAGPQRGAVSPLLGRDGL